MVLGVNFEEGHAPNSQGDQVNYLSCERRVWHLMDLESGKKNPGYM